MNRTNYLAVRETLILLFIVFHHPVKWNKCLEPKNKASIAWQVIRKAVARYGYVFCEGREAKGAWLTCHLAGQLTRLDGQAEGRLKRRGEADRALTSNETGPRLINVTVTLGFSILVSYQN